MQITPEEIQQTAETFANAVDVLLLTCTIIGVFIGFLLHDLYQFYLDRRAYRETLLDKGGHDADNR